MDLTDQALLAHCSTKHFLNTQHVLSTTAGSIITQYKEKGADLAVMNFRVFCWE
jgi:hypothetical protein